MGLDLQTGEPIDPTVQGIRIISGSTGRCCILGCLVKEVTELSKRELGILTLDGSGMVSQFWTVEAQH